MAVTSPVIALDAGVENVWTIIWHNYLVPLYVDGSVFSKKSTGTLKS